MNTSFSAAHLLSTELTTFGHKASLNRHKKIEITFCILSDHQIKNGYQQQKQKKVSELIKTDQLINE